MPKRIQHRGLIVQHRHDHRAQRVRRLDHAHHSSLEPFLHSWSIVGGVISLLAILRIYVDLEQGFTSTLSHVLEEKA
jgi:hypothetical protein